MPPWPPLIDWKPRPATGSAWWRTSGRPRLAGRSWRRRPGRRRAPAGGSSTAPAASAGRGAAIRTADARDLLGESRGRRAPDRRDDDQVAVVLDHLDRVLVDLARAARRSARRAGGPSARDRAAGEHADPVGVRRGERQVVQHHDDGAPRLARPRGRRRAATPGAGCRGPRSARRASAPASPGRAAGRTTYRGLLAARQRREEPRRPGRRTSARSIDVGDDVVVVVLRGRCGATACGPSGPPRGPGSRRPGPASAAAPRAGGPARGRVVAERPVVEAAPCRGRARRRRPGRRAGWTCRRRWARPARPARRGGRRGRRRRGSASCRPEPAASTPRALMPEPLMPSPRPYGGRGGSARRRTGRRRAR